MYHDWPVKKAIVDLPIKMRANSKRLFLSPLGCLNKAKEAYFAV